MICAGGFVRWRAPSPLWRLALEDEDLTRFSQPAVLRFAGTGFMEELIAQAQAAEPALDHLVARPETASRPDVGWRAEGAAPGLRLYHPVSDRFYMVAASLVCQGPGQPDATLNPDAGDTLSFVVRRLIYLPPPLRHHPQDAFREMAWVGGKVPGWRSVDGVDVLDAEERHPLFSLPLRPEGQLPGPEDRFIHVGVIPAQNREIYLSSPATLAEETPYPDPRLLELWDRVLTPLERLRALPGEELAPRISALLLLELAAFLYKQLPGYWEQAALLPYWRDVLRQLWPERRAVLTGALPEPAHDLRSILMEGDLEALSRSVLMLGLEQAAAEPPAIPGQHRDLYVARAVYERPASGRPVVSDPTTPFQLAPMEDPHAPPQPFKTLPGLLKLVDAVRKVGQ